MWLDPEFVSSFDVDDFVYFFFREHSLEHANCGHVVYSRVARVCKVSHRVSCIRKDAKLVGLLYVITAKA